MTLPDFDNADLGIIALTLLGLFVCVLAAILLFSGKDIAGVLSIVGLAITGIAGLANPGAKSKEGP